MWMFNVFLLFSVLVLRVSCDTKPCKIILLQTKEGFVIRCSAVLKVTSVRGNHIEKITTGRRRSDVITKKNEKGERNVTLLVSNETKENDIIEVMKEIFPKGEDAAKVNVASRLPAIKTKEYVELPVTCVNGEMLDHNGECTGPEK